MDQRGLETEMVDLDSGLAAGSLCKLWAKVEPSGSQSGPSGYWEEDAGRGQGTLVRRDQLEAVWLAGDCRGDGRNGWFRGTGEENPEGARECLVPTPTHPTPAWFPPAVILIPLIFGLMSHL